MAIVGGLAGCSDGSVPQAPDVAASQESTSPAGVVEQENPPPVSSMESESTLPADSAEQESTPPTSTAESITGPAAEPYEPRTGDGVDVVYFETSAPCSCMAKVGDAIEYAVLTHFQDELQSGELRYFLMVSNAPANIDLVKTFNSQPFDLFIVESIDGQETMEPVYDIWNLTGDDAAMVDFVHTLVLSSLEGQQ